MNSDMIKTLFIYDLIKEFVAFIVVLIMFIVIQIMIYYYRNKK